MAYVVISALAIASMFFVYLGYRESGRVRRLGDLIPVVSVGNARIDSSAEFRATTVATTVSLATIIIAYFELAGYFGLFLLWTAVTTAVGMLLVSLASQRIWERLEAYDYRPSLHNYLGVEFGSPAVSLIASLCTTVGFLLIFATELLVGSRFLAGLVPQIPSIVTVVFLCVVGFLYTLLGGFRTVVTTDGIQMKLIWALILALAAFYVVHLLGTDLTERLARAPDTLLDFQHRPGLGWFLLGIAIMNIPTHISNMAMWQRIGGARSSETVAKGVRTSIFSIVSSWGLLAILAVAAYLIVEPESNQTVLTELLSYAGQTQLGLVLVFVVTLGLLGAMLSTASTLLIAVTHTVSEDIIAPLRPQAQAERLTSRAPFVQSRLILALSAISAIGIVVGLDFVGFSVADLVFAIYGGALSLFPPIALSLYLSRQTLSALSRYAVAAVTLGFVFGWGAAFLGKLLPNANLVFMSPAFGIGASMTVLAVGLFTVRARSSSPTLE